ncbi:MAG: hypothetical protein ACTSRQ_12705 [Candidatus Thorarchaeota archaeon]
MIGAILKPVLKYAVKGGVAIACAVFLAGIVVEPLHHIPQTTPQILRVIGAGTSFFVLLVGFGALIFVKDWRLLKYTLPIGIIAPSAIYLVSYALVLPQIVALLSPTEIILIIILSTSGIIILIDMLTGKFSGTPWFKSLSVARQPAATYNAGSSVAISASTTSIDLVGAYEIVEMPEEYIFDTQPSNPKFWEPFRNMLRAMMASRAPFGFRFERIMGMTRLYYLTLGNSTENLQSNLDLLKRLLSSMLPKFRFERRERFTPTQFVDGVVGTLTGEILSIENPRQCPDPMTVIAESLLQMENGIFQIYATPVAPGVMRSFKRMMTNREYRSTMQKAQHTISTKRGGLFSGGGESSTTVVDIETTTEADRLFRKHQRQSVEHACNAEISVACWGRKDVQSERNARLILEVTKSTIVPDDPTNDLKVRIYKKPELAKHIVSGRPIGRTTLLTPEEFAMLFTLSKCDVSIVLSKKQAFSTATRPVPESVETSVVPVSDEQLERKLVYSEWKFPNHNAIFLGNPMSINGCGMAGQFVWFYPQKLESHLAIYGNTRSGKTTTAVSVTAQAMKCGIHVLALIPMRSADWMTLMHLFPDSFWIFKVGGDSDLSLRLNMFQPPPGVQVAEWIVALGDLLSSWMPNDRVMRMHLDDVLHTAYRNCGWDIDNNKVGRPILLSNLWDAIEEVCLNIPYGNEMRQNFYGAIYSRFSKLIRNKILVEVYNTEEGITWEQIANNSIMICTEGLSSEEDRSFLMGLVSTGLHMYKRANQTKDITNLLVLEEASYLLKNPDGADHYGHNMSHFTVNRIVEILTTGGGNGLAVMILEQFPGRLLPAVVKLIVNTIVHAMGEGDERGLIGGHIGVDDKRIEHVHQLGKGETIVFLEGEGATRSVKILPLNKFLDFPLPNRKIKDAEIIKHMEPVHEKFPGLKKSTAIPKEIKDRIERAKPSSQTSPTPAQSIPIESSAIKVKESKNVHEFLDNHILDLVQNPKFVNNLVKRMEPLKEGDFEPLVTMVINVTEEFVYDGVKQLWVAECLVKHTHDLYPNMLSQHLMVSTLERLQEQLG